MGIRDELEKVYDFDILDEFLDHYSMMMDVLELTILDLEREDFYRRNIDELFRIFHNIKSATGYLKLTSINSLAEFVESALDELRELKGPANEETISWLLKIADIFKAWQVELSDNKESLTKINFKLLKLPDMEQ
jgi:chemotaxis protein histidine kinase CheA